MDDFEEMPLPTSRELDFPNWLVPARNNIQHQLLRIRKLLGPPSKSLKQRPITKDEWLLLNLIIGAAFSLWRAVFQAGHDLGPTANIEAGRKFIDEVVRNNMAIYATELNSWSLAYYLSNARFRLVRAIERSNSNSKDLDANLLERYDRLRQVLDKPDSAPTNWVECFHVLRLFLDHIEKHGH